MSQYELIATEISAILDELEEQGRQLEPKWVTHAIVADRVAEVGDLTSGDFFRWAAYTTIRELVRKAINKRAGDKAEDTRQQISLPGFERRLLQDYYVVSRDGEDIGVPITLMSDDEIDAKQAVYRAMGATCFEHARELARYKMWRRQSEAAA